MTNTTKWSLFLSSKVACLLRENIQLLALTKLPSVKIVLKLIFLFMSAGFFWKKQIVQNIPKPFQKGNS